jgi:hypothetical protein
MWFKAQSSEISLNAHFLSDKLRAIYERQRTDSAEQNCQYQRTVLLIFAH